MTPKEAYKILINKCPGFESSKCTEYDDKFVFDLVRKGCDPTDKAKRLLLPPRSVDKKTGAVKTFNPLSIPADEYLSGKRITDFK